MSIAVREVVDGTQSVAANLIFARLIDAKLTTAGFVVTSDTGQIDLTANITSATTGYKVYKFNDALKTSAPFIFKVTYGIGASIINNGGISSVILTFQFGRTTDGAGNFTGSFINSTDQFVIYNNGFSSNANGCYFSADTNRFCMVLWSLPTQFEMAFGFERTKDNNGNDTTDGLIILRAGHWYNSGSPAPGTYDLYFGESVAPYYGYIAPDCQMFPTVAAVTDQPTLHYWPAAINQAQNTMATAAKIGAAMPIPFNVLPYNPGFNFALYQGTDYPQYSIQQIMVYGVAHSYLVCNAGGTSPTNPPAASHFLMRYE